MNKKINRMQLVLIIASLLIVFANISLFSSDLVENVAIKAIISILIPTILLVISYEVENVLKLKTSSKYITLMSMFSFFISLTGIYSEILNNITLVDDYIKVGGLFINPSMIVALFAIIIPIIGYFLNKDSFYKKIIVVSSLYFMLFGFRND